MTELNQPSKISDLASVQPGAVVSRELLRSKKGTVTVFAFGKGQGLSDHTNPFQALLQVIEGTATVTIDTRKHVVQSGQMILLPANIPHAVMAESDMKMLLIMIRE